MIELNLGDTISYDGREYVITYLSHMQDSEGHAIRLDGVDPLRAQVHIERQRLQKTQLEQQVKLLPKFERMANEALNEQPEDP